MRLIDAEQYRKEFLDSRDFEPMKILDFQPTVDAIPIPKGATNGDMIKAMFQDADIIEFMGTITVDIPIHGAKCRQKIRFDLDWWNAQYKKEGQE